MKRIQLTVHVGNEEAVNKNKGRKYSILRRLLAFIFSWLITAAFVVLPGSLNNLEQSHPQKVDGVLRSVQNVPLYVPFLPFLIFHFKSPLPSKSLSSLKVVVNFDYQIIDQRPLLPRWHCWDMRCFMEVRARP
jgi:hypothetical protein